MVNEGVNVILGVSDGVIDAVGENVRVNDEVSVTGWKGVLVPVTVGVLVGVFVMVGVELAVPVNTIGVGLKLGVSDAGTSVSVCVAVGVRLPGVGATAIAKKPRQ